MRSTMAFEYAFPKPNLSALMISTPSTSHSSWIFLARVLLPHPGIPDRMRALRTEVAVDMRDEVAVDTRNEGSKVKDGGGGIANESPHFIIFFSSICVLCQEMPTEGILKYDASGSVASPVQRPLMSLHISKYG